MSRQPETYLSDIRHAIEKINSYRERIDKEIGEDDMQTDAIIRNLEVIGEAVKNLSAEERGRCEEIEWEKIAGLRDILIHQYFGVNQEILEDIVRNKLPELEKCLEKIEDRSE